jgi:PEP-CTERM motif
VIKINLLLLARTALCAVAAGSALGLASAQAGTTTITVNGQDDVYRANGADGSDGLAPQSINVTGQPSITFSVSTGRTVTVDGGVLNDADGVGSVSGEFNTGANGISGITTPTAGAIIGVFEGATLTTTPAALNFDTGVGNNPGTTSFASLSPELQQAFFIGDGLTGDGTGATQTFDIPTGATTLYLGLADACGFSGAPSCFFDNSGSFTVTANGTAALGGVPEPASWALMLIGVGMAGGMLRVSQRVRLALLAR